MSNRIMSLCWQLDDMSGTEKAVLIALADRADEVGLCWPSIATIAEMTCFSDRAVRQCVRSLTEKGVLTVQISPGGKSNKYIINTEPRAASNPERRSPGTSFTRNHVPSNPEPRAANPEPRSPKPSLTIKEPSSINTPPDGVDKKLWSDFLTIRKAKKAPITETALNGIRREAEKAGVTLSLAIETCCERGWAGFKADWVQNKGGFASRPNQSNDDWVPPEMRALSEKTIEAERV